MDGMASVGGAATSVAQARFQTERQVRVLKEQVEVTEDLAAQAVKLIESAAVIGNSGGVEGALDVRA